MSYKDFRLLPRIVEGIRRFLRLVLRFLYLAFLPMPIIKIRISSDCQSLIAKMGNTDRRRLR